MVPTTLLLCLCFGLSGIISLPYNGYSGYAPGRTVMFGGYYGQPFDAGRSYIPQGTMTGFSAGDTIATNTFVGGDRGGSSHHAADSKPVHELTEPSPEEEQASSEIEETFTEAPKPRRIPKKKPTPRPSKEEEEEEQEEDEQQGKGENENSWPFNGNSRNHPSYNTFFPIVFGSNPSGFRSRPGASGNEGFYPGAATSIANSFSTGRGGVATSHATSFGDPSLSSFLRNGSVNTRRAKPQD